MFESQDLENLKLKLRQYGLNPEEWLLKAGGRGLFLVVNREDQDFSLVGRAKGRRGRRRWADLRLRSV